MKQLSEAFKKSMIDKLERINKIITKFSWSDIESGDIVLEKSEDSKRIWMYLSHDDFMKHISELYKISYSEREKLIKSDGVFVSPCVSAADYGLYRIPTIECYFYNGEIYTDDEGYSKFTKLIKFFGALLKSKKTIKEIFKENKNFEEYI